MTTSPTAPISEADYCAIEDALQATEKGRRFLGAYVDRNRSLESLRLLRSISRLHRAALGFPGFGPQVSRDIAMMLKCVARSRRKAAECDSDETRLAIYSGALEEIEAFLIVLLESVEEKAFDAADNPSPSKRFSETSDLQSPDRAAKLFGELSSLFSEQR
jgi:hypothetical protein